MDTQESETREPHILSHLGQLVHGAIPILLVIAALFLVIRNWMHFDATDIAVLVLIFASVVMRFLIRRSMPSEGPDETSVRTADKRRAF